VLAQDALTALAVAPNSHATCEDRPVTPLHGSRHGSEFYTRCYTAHPAIGTGEVLVDVVAAPVLSYTGEVLSGARRYLLPTPVVPGAGAIGRVRAESHTRSHTTARAGS